MSPSSILTPTRTPCRRVPQLRREDAAATSPQATLATRRFASKLFSKR